MSHTRILVAIDHSSTSQTIFETALTLAQQNQAALMLVHVLDPFDADYPVPVYSTIDPLYPTLYEAAIKAFDERWKHYETEGVNLLRSLCHQAQDAGMLCEYRQEIGEPGPMLCSIAQTWGADLIIVGRRGRTGMSEWWLGSVSNYVLHHAPCSVLTLQEQKLSQLTDLETSQTEILCR